MDSTPDRVVPLDELDDYRVAEGDPDVRGWEVFAADGRRIGEVDNLLVDRNAMKVRYLDVEMDDELGGGGDKHILIPIGYARLDESEDQVRVDSLDSSRLSLTPAYGHEPLTRDYENSLRTHFSPTSGIESPLGSDISTDIDDDGYVGEMYDDRRFYGSRRRNVDNDRFTRADESEI